MKFEVYAADQLHCSVIDNACVISIVSPGAEWPSIACDNILRLAFHDVDRELVLSDRTIHPMTNNQAKEIMEFFEKNVDKPRCVVHCEAGISRSPAVAIALSELVDGTPCAEALIERYPTFNRHVYRSMWEAGMESHLSYKDTEP